MPITPSEPRALETAHVLFLDIVGYTKWLIDEQTQRIQQLQDIVRSTREFERQNAKRQLIALPTGDGMALVFFIDQLAPVRCALEISNLLRDIPEIEMRMGINSGPVYRTADINQHEGVSGNGINIAQRVMDCGETGHILLSKAVGDVLLQTNEWKDFVFDLGEAEVKHGVRVHLFSLCRDGAGRTDPPQKIKPKKSQPASRLAPSESNLGPLVSKLCDRSAQVSAFTEHFISNIKTNLGTPQFYFIHGDESECHDSLIERLAHTEIKQIAEKKWGEARAAVALVKITWPREGDSFGLQRELQRQLFTEFEPGYLDDDLSATALSKLAARTLQPVIVVRHNLYASSWNKEVRSLLVWYLGYWAEIKQQGLEPQFVIFFNVIYPGVRGLGKWKTFIRSLRSNKSSIQQELIEICHRFKSVCPSLMLKELAPPKQHDVDDWFRRHNIYDLKMQTAFLNDLYSGAEETSMANVEFELTKVHQSFVRERGFR